MIAANENIVTLSGDYATVRRWYEQVDRRCVVFDLRSHGARKLWQEVAYEPRLDVGDTVPLRPHCHESGAYGWMD